MIEWFKENWFWFLFFFGSGFFAFLQTTNPVTLAILCTAILACHYCGKLLEIQEKKLKLEQKKFELEQKKVDAIMSLDEISSDEKWQKLRKLDE